MKTDFFFSNFSDFYQIIKVEAVESIIDYIIIYAVPQFGILAPADTIGIASLAIRCCPWFWFWQLLGSPPAEGRSIAGWNKCDS